MEPVKLEEKLSALHEEIKSGLEKLEKMEKPDHDSDDWLIELLTIIVQDMTNMKVLVDSIDIEDI